MALKTNISKENLSPAEKAMKILAIAVDRASEKITASSDNAIVKILKAADLASDKIANDALKATDVVANNAAAALKVSTALGGNDHDLLIRLETKMTGLKDDIKDIKDGTSAKIADHETRIFALETSKTRQATIITVGVSIVVILLSIILYHLFGIKI